MTDAIPAPYITEERFMRLEEVARETSTQVVEHGAKLNHVSEQVSDLKEQVSERIDSAFNRLMDKIESQNQRLQSHSDEQHRLSTRVEGHTQLLKELTKVESDRVEAKKKEEEAEKSRRSFRREKILIPIGMLAAGAMLKPVIEFLIEVAPLVLKVVLGG